MKLKDFLHHKLVFIFRKMRRKKVVLFYIQATMKTTVSLQKLFMTYIHL